MNSLVRRSFLVGSVMLGISAMGIAANAVTSALRKPPPAPVIAVVDLQEVVKGLDERTNKEQELYNKGVEFKDMLDKKKKDLDDTRSQIEAATTSAQRLPLQKRAYLQENELKFETEFSQQQLDLLYGDMLRDLYAQITAAATKLSEQNGYTMVLSSDESVDIARGTRNDVVRTVAMKRMLYVNDAHDITADVITMINIEFAAKGGKRVTVPTSLPPSASPSSTPAPAGKP